jgi:hypothetical protein
MKTYTRRWEAYLFGENGYVFVERLRGAHVSSRHSWFSGGTRRQLALFENESQQGEQRVTATEITIQTSIHKLRDVAGRTSAPRTGDRHCLFGNNTHFPLIS